MGAIAEFFVAYAQPLLDITDGSFEQTEKAFGLAQVCFNLAQLPLDEREEFIQRMQSDMGLDDAEFADFRQGLIDPMMARHDRAASLANLAVETTYRNRIGSDHQSPRPKVTVDRYAPCPCQSGKKYKFCCGAK